MMNLILDGENIGVVYHAADVEVRRETGIIVEARLYDPEATGPHRYHYRHVRLTLSVPLAMRIAELVPGFTGTSIGDGD